jgi:uncharacterized damage-inducible protein DinB
VNASLATRLRYNAWANDLLFRELVAKAAPEAAMRAFQHVLETEITWSCRILGMDNPPITLWKPVSAETRALWVRTARAQLDRVVAEGGPDPFSRTFRYRSYAGQEFEDAVAEVLEHTLLHSAQYRGEAAGLSNAAGVQMPDLDYIIWLRTGMPDAQD